MTLINYYDRISKKDNPRVKNPNFKLHGLEVPFRIGIIGSSGSGKTNLVCNLIHLTSGTFEKIYLIIPSGAEPLYELLKSKLNDKFIVCEGIESTPQIDTIETTSSLVIFDDMAPEPLKKQLQFISPYYIRGRKKNLSVIYISQNFYSIPKIIRNQLGYLFIKKLSSKRDMNAIIRDASLDTSRDELGELYDYCVNQQNSFLMIDILKANMRCGFTDII